MGLFNWLNPLSKLNHQIKFTVKCGVPAVPLITAYSLTETESMFKNRKLYFSKYIQEKINNDFLDHDGYFVKLISNKKVIGYIFRCTYKNVELVDNNNQKKIIPFLVTCFYQPNIEFTPVNYIKTLGKAHTLKTGVRAIKEYVKNTNDLNLSCFKDSIMDFNQVFPVYNKMVEDPTFGPEFWNMSEKEYNTVLDYIKAFDDKIFKYYNGIDNKNIVKIWLKN